MSQFDETDLARIEVVKALFAAWSSGDVDAPRQYLQMSATVIDDSMGTGHLGKKWLVPGLSFLVFDGLLVDAEYDYHDKGARQRSLES